MWIRDGKALSSLLLLPITPISQMWRVRLRLGVTHLQCLKGSINDREQNILYVPLPSAPNVLSTHLSLW